MSDEQTTKDGIRSLETGELLESTPPAQQPEPSAAESVTLCNFDVARIYGYGYPNQLAEERIQSAIDAALRRELQELLDCVTGYGNCPPSLWRTEELIRAKLSLLKWTPPFAPTRRKE